MIVPTRNTVRFEKLIFYNLNIQTPVFLTGNVGVGKSLIVQQALANKVQKENLHTI